MDDEKKRLMEQRLREARDKYAAQLPGRVLEVGQTWERLLGSAWDPGVLQALHRQVHSLAGSGGTFGFPAVGSSARAVEILLKQLLQRATPPDTAEQGEIQAGLAHLRQEVELSLNRRADAEEGAAVAPASLVLTPPVVRGGNRLIFLVEDDPALRRDLAGQLAYYGFQVETFDTLGGFRKGLSRQEPAVVIMDVHLPDGLGTKAVMVVQKERPGAPLPVVFISSLAGLDSRLRAVRAGGVAYFQKPLDITQIIDVLDTFINASEQASYRVLLVEDSPSLAEHVALVLEGAGMEIRVVTDPMAVMEPLENFHPDLILMDLYMPGCSGLELAKVIRQQQAYLSIPIVYLSAETSMTKQLAALSLGGDDFLTKPIQPDYLVSSVISRIKRARKLRALLVRDGLTGLLNHTTTRERLAQEVERCKRGGGRLAFAMIDIDHFKAVNDTYGHPTGDGVIKSLARLLQQRLRRTDIVGRFGGEEFAVILLDTNRDDTVALLNQLRNDFARVVHHSQQEGFTKTFSCGVAFLDDHPSDSALNDAADQALYRAKEGGRNRVVVAGG